MAPVKDYMHLNIEISQEVFEKLKHQANKSGVSIETAAQQRLAESVRLSNQAETANSRWSFNGMPWTTVSREQIAEQYTSASESLPEGPEEFAWHADDARASEDRD